MDNYAIYIIYPDFKQRNIIFLTGPWNDSDTNSWIRECIEEQCRNAGVSKSNAGCDPLNLTTYENICVCANKEELVQTYKKIMVAGRLNHNFPIQICFDQLDEIGTINFIFNETILDETSTNVPIVQEDLFDYFDEEGQFQTNKTSEPSEYHTSMLHT